MEIQSVDERIEVLEDRINQLEAQLSRQSQYLVSPMERQAWNEHCSGGGSFLDGIFG